MTLYRFTVASGVPLDEPKWIPWSPLHCHRYLSGLRIKGLPSMRETIMSTGHPDDQQFNDTDPNVPSDSNLVGQSVDEREPSGLHRCPSCDRLFGSWHDYSEAPPRGRDLG
jgi:hypothetical protein